MSATSYSALSRRRFLYTFASAAGAMTLPLRVRASSPGPSALAFDGDGLLVAGNGLIRSDDGGRSWQPLATPEPIVALATHPDRPGRVVAGLSHGISVSEDGGRSWQPRAEGLPGGEVLAVGIAAGAPDTFHAAVAGDGLWQSEDAGRSWSFVMDRPWLDGTERDPLTLASVDLASGMGGIWIYAGTEAGLTRVPDCFCRWQDVQPGNAMDALVSGDAPPPESPLPEGKPVLAIVSAPSAPSTLYAALPSGLWSSQDGGVVWAQVSQGAASAVAVSPNDRTHVAAVLNDDLQISRDGGASWTATAVA